MLYALMEQPAPPPNRMRFLGLGASEVGIVKNLWGLTTLGWFGMTETVTLTMISELDKPNRPMAMGVPVRVSSRDVPTPCIAWATQHEPTAGALQFTASHNPASYNGIKMCRAAAKPVGEDTGLAVIRDEVIAGVPGYDGPRGTVSDRDVLAEYGAYLRSLVAVDTLRPMRVAVDAGNGMAGHTTPAVLGPISGVTVLPLYFELDGTFPHHEANPLEPANLVDLQEFVRDRGADIGLAFDGDADRCFVVDERGEPVSPSAITALVAARELAREPGAGIIHNLITSRVVPELVARNGGRPIRSRVGHSYIKALMADSGAIFGGEHSAHYYFRDFWGADSGMLAALHVLAALGEQDRPLSELISDYQRYAASGEINFRVDDAPACVDDVVKSFAAQIVSLDHLDGVTVDLGDSAWFNLRTSNTQPLLRLNVEARSPDEVSRIVDHVAEQIGARNRTGG